MENIGNSGVSGNRIASKYTYLRNSPEFRVVLEPCERILTVASNVGENLVALAGNAMPIGRTKELVARGKRRHVVGVTGDISKGVRHGDRGKR